MNVKVWSGLIWVCVLGCHVDPVESTERTEMGVQGDDMSPLDMPLERDSALDVGDMLALDFEEMSKPDVPDVMDAGMDVDLPKDADMASENDMFMAIPDVDDWTFEDRGVVWSNEVEFQGMNYVLPVSDVSVRRNPDGPGWVMSYTCIDYDREFIPTQICRASSADGLTWEPEASPWLVGMDRDAQYFWEGSEYIIDDGEQYVLASWYPAPTSPNAETFNGNVTGYPATLALMGVKADGSLEALNDALMQPSLGTLDHHAVYSPTWVKTPEQEHIIYYAGHCFPQMGECPLTTGGVSLAWAKANTLQGPWEKQGQVEFVEPRPAWAGFFLAEPGIMHDGKRYWMAVTGYSDQEQGVAIGLATSEKPEGPWLMQESPLVELQGGEPWSAIVAPSLIFDQDTIHVWYTLFDSTVQSTRLGYVQGQLKTM